MSGQARLVVPDPAGARAVVVEDTPFTLGRQAGNQLVLSDADVSRVHAEIVADGDRYVISDKGSRFGTFVNGGKLDGPHVLAHGDHIQLGSVARPPLEFQIVSDEITRTTRSALAGGAGAGAGGGAGDGAQGHSIDMLGKALRALAEGHVLEEVLAIVVDQAVALSGAERGLVMMPNKDGGLEIKMARGRRGLALEAEAFRHSSKIPQEAAHSGKLVYKDDLYQDDEREAHGNTVQFGIRSVLCCPLPAFGETRVPGALYVDSRGKGRLASPDLHAAFQQLAVEAAVALENARLVRETQEKIVLEKELDVAARLQQALLPPPTRVTKSYELAGRTIPCRAIGGDFYEHAELAGERLGFARGDVSGKGPPAALLAAVIQGILASHAEDETNPGETLARLNRTLVHRSLESRFATIAFAIAGADGSMAVSNAGHNPTYVLRANGSVESLDKGGLPVGIFPQADYDQESIQLEPGDAVILFSDGVTEAENAQKEQFEDERLRACLSEARDLGAEGVLGRIVDAVQGFARGAPQADDITVLVVRYRGPGVPAA
jgi:serine phosphatase RsbU (regulator of sigma subunit)